MDGLRQQALCECGVLEDCGYILCRYKRSLILLKERIIASLARPAKPVWFCAI